MEIMNTHKVINDWIKVYMIGPMEQTRANDAGKGWRSKLEPELRKRRDSHGNPIYVFNPCSEEQNKVGMDAGTFHKKLKGWINSGNNDKVAEGADLIWRGKTFIEQDGDGKARLVKILGDNDYTVNSTFLIARMEEGDVSCGTFGEAHEAFTNRIPIYVLQTMPREKYPVTFTGWVFASGGGFFHSQNELLAYIDKKYELTIKNEVEKTDEKV
jgi:hypothetical protein